MRNVERDNAVGYLVWKLSNAAHTALEGALGDVELTVAQMCALVSIDDASSDSMADLARELHMTPQNMGLVVTKLERDGHIARHPHETNRRIQRLALTERGHRAMNIAVEHAREVDAIMMADLSGPEKLALAKMLQRCVRSLRLAGRSNTLPVRKEPPRAKKSPPPVARKNRM